LRSVTKRILLLLIIAAFQQRLAAQEIPDFELELPCDVCRIDQLILDIEQRYPFKIFYQRDWFTKSRVSFNSRRISLRSFLSILSSSSQINSIFRKPNYIIFLKPELVFNSSKTITEITIGSAGKTSVEIARMTGIIMSSETKEPVLGASVFVKELGIGTSTNMQGKYSLEIPPGIYQISFGATNLTRMEFDFKIINDGTFDLELSEDVTLLNEVAITDKRERDIVDAPQMGVSTLRASDIAKIPSYMGEVDVLRAVSVLPGVSNVGEGSAGMNVRGGMAGQNLILMDGMPLYNPAHLAGFFSTFNPDVVDQATLYRGGVPAQFGGRSSAYLDVKLKDGNRQKLQGTGGAGVLASRFSLRGPLSNKTSFVTGLRAAYPNYIIRGLRDENIKKSRAFFYDFNGKLDHEFSDKSKLSLSLYSSLDNINLAQQTTYSFGNNSAHIQWSKLFGNDFLLKISAIESYYQYSVQGGELDRSYKLNASINDARFNTEISFFSLENHTLSLGWQNTLYRVNTGDYSPQEGANLTPINLAVEHALESALYLQDQFKVSSKIILDAGIRYTTFFRMGPGSVRQYASGEPLSEASFTEEFNYGSGEVMKVYNGLEPRASIVYKLSPTSSLKAGYHRLYQYIHLLSNTTAVTPIDLWKISNQYIRPNYADQISLGYFRTLHDFAYDLSLEGYYKVSQNVIDYKNGATLYRNPYVEQDILQGVGRAYGAELLVKKNKGRLKGWLAYTFSRSLLSFNGAGPSEIINSGNFYPANFDRPHDLKVFTDWTITNRFSLSTNFTYSTGRPITAPVGSYQIRGIAVIDYSERNQIRIPDNHHLDMTLTMNSSLKKKKAVSANWSISIYNIYGRRNPYSVFFRVDDLGRITGYKLSIFGSPFFSLSYNFKF
jgi:hypothetical protein